MKLIGIYLSERQIEYLKKESDKKDLSVSEIIRRVLDSYCFGEIVTSPKSEKNNKDENT